MNSETSNEIKFWAHMLDEAFCKQLLEADSGEDGKEKDSGDKEQKKDKVSVDSLIKEIKLMRPGAVMQFIAKQFGMNSTEFVLKYSP